MATTRSARFQERFKLLLNARKKVAPVSLAVSEPARRCFGSLRRFASHQPNRSALNAGGADLETHRVSTGTSRGLADMRSASLQTSIERLS